MTAEAQRIAIAEACGWLLDHINRYAMYYAPSMDCHVGDPLSDLNACHEFEKVLTNEQRRDYEFTICRTISMGRMNIPIPTLYDFDMIHATASQRAEAFLKAINKWTNDR